MLGKGVHKLMETAARKDKDLWFSRIGGLIGRWLLPGSGYIGNGRLRAGEAESADASAKNGNISK
jgi:hypothetical protein